MSALQRWLEAFIDMVWLSVVWAVSSLLLVTAPAATVALVATAHDLQTGEAGRGITQTFIRHFRGCLGRATVIGLAWGAVVAVLAIDFLLVSGMGALRVPLIIVFVLLAGVVAGSSAMLPHVMRHGPYGFRSSLKQSVFIAVARPLEALTSLLSAAVAIFGVLTMPLLLLILPALAAHGSVLAWRRAVENLRVRVMPTGATDI